MAEPRPPRSPLRVAVISFGAVVLIGTLVSLVGFGANRWMHDDPSGRGQRVGQGIGVLGGVCAAVGYFVQRRRIGPARGR